jgi:hemoglobin
MSAGGPWEHRGRDLDSREEIAELVTRFYRDVAQDDLLHPYFNHIARVDWYDHVGTLTDFWCGILLGAPRAEGDVIEAHRWLHEHTPFGPELFDRWLETFTTTVDAGWTGPVATQATKRARGMARAMARRLMGEGAWRPDVAA